MISFCETDITGLLSGIFQPLWTVPDTVTDFHDLFFLQWSVPLDMRMLTASS